jgi:hypothetical protein
VPAPFRTGRQAASGGEERDDAGQQQDFFHIQFFLAENATRWTGAAP